MPSQNKLDLLDTAGQSRPQSPSQSTLVVTNMDDSDQVMQIALPREYAWIMLGVALVVLVYFLGKIILEVLKKYRSWQENRFRNRFVKNVTNTEFISPTISIQGSKCSNCGCSKVASTKPALSSARNLSSQRGIPTLPKVQSIGSNGHHKPQTLPYKFDPLSPRTDAKNHIHFMFGNRPTKKLSDPPTPILKSHDGCTMGNGPAYAGGNNNHLPGHTISLPGHHSAHGSGSHGASALEQLKNDLGNAVNGPMKVNPFMTANGSPINLPHTHLNYTASNPNGAPIYGVHNFHHHFQQQQSQSNSNSNSQQNQIHNYTRTMPNGENSSKNNGVASQQQQGKHGLHQHKVDDSIRYNATHNSNCKTGDSGCTTDNSECREIVDEPGQESGHMTLGKRSVASVETRNSYIIRKFLMSNKSKDLLNGSKITLYGPNGTLKSKKNFEVEHGKLEKLVSQSTRTASSEF